MLRSIESATNAGLWNVVSATEAAAVPRLPPTLPLPYPLHPRSQPQTSSPPPGRPRPGHCHCLKTARTTQLSSG